MPKDRCSDLSSVPFSGWPEKTMGCVSRAWKRAANGREPFPLPSPAPSQALGFLWEENLRAVLEAPELFEVNVM